MTTGYRPMQRVTPGRPLTLLVLLFWLLPCLVSLAYSEPFVCRPFSANDGLPSSYCFTPFQDRDGYLWVGTYGGVSRFDGNTFQNFTVNDGLVNNQVLSFCQPRDGAIWMGTFSGISIWKQGRFRNITHVGSIPVERVWNISQTSDGRIWATSTQGLLMFRNAEAPPILYQLDTHNRPVQNLWGLCSLPSGKLLVSDSDHLFLFENNRFAPVTYDNGQPVEARCLVREGDRVFVGTYEQGLLEYRQNRVKPLYTNLLPAKLRVFNVLTDHQNRFWLATNQGAICIDKGKLTVLNSKNALTSDRCLGMCKDTEGSVWLALPEGLVQCKDRFIDTFTQADGLLNYEIYSLAKDPRGVIYFGGCNGPFSAYRPNAVGGGTFFQPFPAFRATLTRELPILFTRFDHQGRLWVSCDADSVYTLRSGEIRKITSVGKFCTAFLETAQDNELWIGGRKKLLHYAPAGTTTIPIPAAMGVDDILALHQDRQRRLWVGTYGLRIFDGKTWTDWSRRTDTKDVFIQAIKTDREGTIWLATIGKGIRKIRLNEQGGIRSVEKITVREGLQNDSVLDIEFDDDGQLWVGSFGGILRMNLKRPKQRGQYVTQLFNRNSGVLDNPWQLVSFLKDDTGNMWVGTSRGAMRFSVRHMPTNTTRPPVHIVSAQFSQNTGESQLDNQSIGNGAVLSYKANKVSFQFAGISLSDPSGIRYTYQLDGLPGASWAALSKEKSVNFSNLSPDTYTLRVKAVNGDGIESVREATFTFTLTPPYWQTWWFRMLIAVLMAGLVIAIVQGRVRFLNQKHQTALQLSEWKLRALQSQMNPHFIFNSLNSIQSYILANKPLEGVKYLSRFSRLMRRILDNSNHQQMPLERIMETLQLYVELEAMRFNHEFSYQFVVEDDDSLNAVSMPPMLFQPFIENAIWHGLMPKTGEKELLIQVQKEASTLLCIIEDNGVGRKNSPKKDGGHTSRGESLTKSTFEAFNQQMGKEATLTIIDKEAPLTGTRVEIRIPL